MNSNSRRSNTIDSGIVSTRSLSVNLDGMYPCSWSYALALKAIFDVMAKTQSESGTRSTFQGFCMAILPRVEDVSSTYIVRLRANHCRGLFEGLLYPRVVGWLGKPPLGNQKREILTYLKVWLKHATDSLSGNVAFRRTLKSIVSRHHVGEA